jgi:hypothetical protein
VVSALICANKATRNRSLVLLCSSSSIFFKDKGKTMLCPKCGFISFDHLSLCAKCQNDLSGIGEELHGTAADVASRFFLGALVKDGSLLRDLPEMNGGEDDTAVSLPLEDNGRVGAEMLIPEEEIFIQQEEARPLAVDDSPSLELDLDDLPHLDSTESGVDIAPVALAEEVAQTEEAEQVTLLEREHLEVVMEEKGEAAVLVSPAEGEDLPGETGSEIDGLNLTLETIDEIDLPTTELPVESLDEENQSGQLTVDLNEIDLSDLVHSTDEAPADQEGVGAGDTGGFELDDTMDLSLFVGDSSESQAAEGVMSTDDDDLNPIDLTLVDEALVEISVDPGRKEQDAHAKVQSDIEGLSMEESTKEGSLP